MTVRLDFRCTEDFDAMPCTARGRHCARCDTEVVDLDPMGWIERQRFLSTPEDKCVRFSRRPSRWRAKAVAFVGLVLSTALPAAAQEVRSTHVCSPGPAGPQEVWVGGVGGRRSALGVVLRPLLTVSRGVRRFVRERTRSPHGDGLAHVATDQAWRRVTVACDSGRVPRRIELVDGEAIVGDLPDEDACRNQIGYGPFRACAAERSALRFALTSHIGPTDVPGRSEEHAVCPLLAVRRIRFVGQGERRTTTVEFWVSDTASEALEHGEPEQGADPRGAAEARSGASESGDPRARGARCPRRRCQRGPRGPRRPVRLPPVWSDMPDIPPDRTFADEPPGATITASSSPPVASRRSPAGGGKRRSEPAGGADARDPPSTADRRGAQRRSGPGHG